MNVCTFGYSYVHWDWKRWEREIDWMALNGVNMPLAFNGYLFFSSFILSQEYIYYLVYKKLGLSTEGILNHFTGPHFQPWNRMGNIKGWGGPITLTYLWNDLLLNKQVISNMDPHLQIVEREVAFGMLPVFPAFSGYVPDEFIVVSFPYIHVQKVYPNVSYSISPSWSNFVEPYGYVVLLEPVDPMFKKVASLFIQEQLYP